MGLFSSGKKKKKKRRGGIELSCCSPKPKRKDGKKESISVDAQAVTITCFGENNKPETYTFSGFLSEADKLIKDLRYEIARLRHSKGDEPGATVKERLLEELSNMRSRIRIVEDENEKLAAENRELAQELKVAGCRRVDDERVKDLEKEGLKMKKSLLRAAEELEIVTSELDNCRTKYECSKAEVERLSKEVSSLELCKMVAVEELQHKLTTTKKKYNELKRSCRGKDMIIANLKGEKSRTLMHLWQTTYGNDSKNAAASSTSGDTSRLTRPTATVEPYTQQTIAVCSASKGPAIIDQVSDVSQVSPDILKKQTMLMEFEMYRKRKMAEIHDEDNVSVWSVSDGGDTVRSVNVTICTETDVAVSECSDFPDSQTADES